MYSNLNILYIKQKFLLGQFLLFDSLRLILLVSTCKKHIKSAYGNFVGQFNLT